MTIELEERDGLLWHGDEPVACHWFAKCDRQATHLEPHPVLGPQPACDRCPEIGK